MSINQKKSGSEPETNLRDFMRYKPVSHLLVPLHNWRSLSKTGQELGKRPIQKDWPNARHSFEAMQEHLKAGNNVGIRLGAGIYVIDWDKRNDPACNDPVANSVARLCRDHGLVLRDDAIVETGNGLHIYTETPPDLKALVNEITKYPGLEMKGNGRQVVCAGSIHPSGKVYRWKA